MGHSTTKKKKNKNKKKKNDLCAQRRWRSSWASAQSDHSLRFAFQEYYVIIVLVKQLKIFSFSHKRGACI